MATTSNSLGSVTVLLMLDTPLSSTILDEVVSTVVPEETVSTRVDSSNNRTPSCLHHGHNDHG